MRGSLAFIICVALWSVAFADPVIYPQLGPLEGGTRIRVDGFPYLSSASCEFWVIQFLIVIVARFMRTLKLQSIW